MNEIDFKIKTLCDISFFNEEGDFILNGKKDFEIYQEKLEIVIEDLSLWVKERYFQVWDEDDVNFLNFLLRSKYLYTDFIFNKEKDLLKKLYLECLTPLILLSNKTSSFFNDLSYWFITRGEAIYKALSLNDELGMLSKHFEKERLS